MVPSAYILLRNSAFVLFSIITLAACGEDDVAQTEEGELVLGSTEVEAVSERGVVPGNRALEFNGFHGRVHFEGTSDSTATLTFYKRVRASSDARARELLDGITIEERGGDDAYRFVMRSDVPERSEVQVTGRVPVDVPLRVQLDSGPVELAGVDGPVTVETTYGDIRVSGATERIQVTTQNGDIVVGLRAVPSGETVSLATQNGDVRLEVPDGLSAQIDARTDAGRISTAGLDFERRRLDRQGTRVRFRGTLATGQGTIEVSTQNGSIDLQEGTGTEPLSPPDALDSDTVEQTVEDDLAPRRPLTPHDSLRPDEATRADTMADDQ